MTGMDGVNFMFKMCFYAVISWAVLQQVVVSYLYSYMVAASFDAGAMAIMDKIVLIINALPFVLIGTGILYNVAYALKYGSGGQAFQD
jgi:hypothetical protein